MQDLQSGKARKTERCPAQYWELEVDQPSWEAAQDYLARNGL
jgi:hypothetical protein